MAENSDEPKHIVNGRKAARLPHNPVQRLQCRELGGAHRHHSQASRGQIFHKLPGRLGFSLRGLVDESVLHEGHVFLGFTKNGKCVLSYTLHLEADEHTAYPIYVYRLQWWRFVPYKRLVKIGEVRLFGEEEIQQDLFLAFCEWPTNDTAVLIHGYCAPSENEEKHACYVTVTAVPPTEPCEDCSQLAILHAQNGFNGGMSSAPPRCLNHAFTVHTKYELAPPYPSFVPKVFLKLDGVVVVNTGDSLVALSVDIEDNHSGFGFHLYSPRITRSVSNLSTMSSSPSEDQMSVDSHERFSDARVSSDVEMAPSEPLVNLLVHSPCSSGTVLYRNPPTPKDTTNVGGVNLEHRTPAALRERHASTGKENVSIVKQLGSPPPVSEGGGTPRHRSIDVYNFEGGTPKKEEEPGDYPDPDSVGTSPRAGSIKAPLSFSSFQRGARLRNSSEEFNFLHSDTLLDSQPLEDLDEKSSSGDHFEKPSGIPRSHVGVREQASNPPPRSFTTNLSLIPPDSFSLGKAMAISPGYGKLDTGSSTCSSCVSSPIILQSESQCFTYSVRRYVDSFSQGRPDSPIDIEDDLNLAYHSLLPLEVHGANYSSMRLLTKQCLTPHMPCVVVKQLTLDIEHYLGETVRTCADWGHRYLSFTDYDVQIVEVCPDTSEVIAVVFVLIRARPPKDPHKNTHGVRSVPKLYQSGFKLIWNLQTGSYNTLDVEDLVEVNQAELIRKRWHPGLHICDALQRRFAVPQPYFSSVHVLTNEAVFKGQSLKMLLDRHHYVAILL